MRPTRYRLLGCLAALGLSLAAAPAGANSITMTWIATSGAGTGVGTPTLVGVSPGDTAVLQIDVHASASGVNAVGVTFQYDNSVVAGAVEQRCPVAGVGNLANGFCGSNVASGLLGTSTHTVNDGALVGGIQWDGVLPGGQANTTFTFAHITFTAVGAGTTGAVFFRPGIDGILTTANQYLIPPATGATIQVVPEPGTLALLGLGLAVLAWRAGIRRGHARG